ncbi:2,4-dienoyl-CoA reductase-like NADH-dependent reductase (Old Yellow Enzyme family) [Dyadobacter jejuensis]|uniref:2,4-dienoyl-CoA reductase-like NADH-dependent reductase (Old Yellow Enzyme family) n=1 Tax=Dyadobacter jejuensis TaxID=1082580 RepID=A0A316B4C8_9BACT|nr:NADH:flavin oxidoreductase/NADH oxidase [Dyadobacter jejuensis]PWJ57447.1 2,4-dienoyl-CoA reductase-like NADH-dependent reductase (Old Yellow Enzyme family) [Dyadobacter jejuensis]
MNMLFSSYKLKNIILRNRLVVSPMCQYSSVDGYATDWHLVHLGSRAVGGAGLVFTEAAAIGPEGRISPKDLGIWKDEHIDKLAQITHFISQQGATPGIQLAHAGRKASTFAPWEGRGQVPLFQGGWKTLAPSPLAFRELEDAPEAMDVVGIANVINDFTSAANRALVAGFKVIEIHAAHGYLLHQFLSPLSNQRTDQYGGSFENRTRLLLEVVRSVAAILPEEVALMVRISATDWAEGGWDLAQSIQLSKLLKNNQVDLVDVSSGGLAAHQKIDVKPGYQVPFAEAIRHQAGVPTGAVGLITNAHQAETILLEGKADLIFMARELLRNPYFPLTSSSEELEASAWPNQYIRAKR